MKRFATAAFAAMALCSAAAACAAENALPEVELLEETWALVKIGATPVGYSHIRVIREKRGDERLIVTSSEEHMGMKRLGAAITIEESTSFTETESGEPRSFRSEQVSSREKKVIEGVIEGDTLKLVTTVMGQARSSSMPWDKQARFPNAIEKTVRGLKDPGDKTQFKTYLPDMGVVTVKAEAKGMESAEVGDRKLDLFRIDSEVDVMHITTTEYRDEEGKVLKSVMSAMGMQISMERTDRDTALRLGTEAAGIDMIVKTMVKPNAPLPHPQRLEGCTYLLTFHSGRLDGVDLGGDERQEVLSARAVDGKLVVELRVSKVVPGPSDKPGAPPGKEYLADTSLLQSADPEIVSAARSATEGVADPYAKAKALESWVSRSITAKNFGVGFASAKETLKTRSGDCTEHAVLLAAMLRAAGIPSKVSAGLVYFKGVFGYHMWAEAYVGKWVALDATLARPFVDATHIEFSESSLDDESPMKPLAAVMAQVAGQLDMEIVDFTLGGRRVSLAELGGPAAFKDGLYTDRINSFSFKLPSGWKLVPKEPREGEMDFATAVFSAPEGSGRLRVEIAAMPSDFSFASFPLLMASRYSVEKIENLKRDGRSAYRASYSDRRSGVEYEGLFALDDDVVISVIGQGLGDAGPGALDGVAESFSFSPPAGAAGGGREGAPVSAPGGGAQ